MSESHADFKGDNHPMFGKHHSEKSKELMSRNSSILKEKDVIEIIKLLNEKKLNQKEIAKKFGFSTATISNIKTGKHWKHLKEIKS